jgi:hypothetical protein
LANPTTNYGFVLPTSSDLVTDLPADFDVALQGVDTRLKALQPGTTLGDLAYSSATANTSTRLPIGTTGQVLAVSGGVPAWTTTADVTPLTTKGDLFTFTTVDARIGVGANGTVLTANSGEASGLEWAAPVSGGMTLISTTTLGSTSTTISSIPGTYNNLVMVLRNAITGGVANFHTRYNSDTGSNYIVTGSNSGSAPNVGTEYAWNQNGNPETASTPMTAIQTIYDYANTSAGAGKYIQTFYTVKNGASSYALGNLIGAWRSTSAITSITLTTIGGTTMSGTALLYGVK